MVPHAGLTALPASGKVWDHRRGMEMVEVPSSLRTAEPALSFVGDAVYYSPLRSLLKVMTEE